MASPTPIVSTNGRKISTIGKNVCVDFLEKRKVKLPFIEEKQPLVEQCVQNIAVKTIFVSKKYFFKFEGLKP
jgi:hypothetical protein